MYFYATKTFLLTDNVKLFKALIVQLLLLNDIFVINSTEIFFYTMKKTERSNRQKQNAERITVKNNDMSRNKGRILIIVKGHLSFANKPIEGRITENKFKS